MEWQGAMRRQRESTLRVEKPARGLIPATTKNVERVSASTTVTPKRQVDQSEATDTPNPHTKCAGPTRPVGTLHDPADEPSGMREGGGVTKSESVSMLIEGRSG